MSMAALDRLIDRQHAMIAALDGADPAAVEQAAAALRDAVAEARAAGGWRARPDLRDTLVRALKHADAARARVNYLADSNRRRLDRLAIAAGAPRAAAYSRAGRLG